MLIPDGPENLYCPDWRKPMSKVCKTCPLWMQRELTVTKPDGSQEKNTDWLCGKALAVINQAELMLAMKDLARRMQGTQAATESMRNEIVTRMDHPPMHRNGQLDLIDDCINGAPKLIGPQ